MDGPAATEQIEAAPPHYGAFISYSHLDLAAAKRLHRQLERYRMPQRLVGSATTDGPLTKRMPPIFRDIDELPASDDLSAEIQAALAASAALIVVASPAAKASHWVGREIETFRALHGTSRPVLLAMIDGEPDAAFPDALAAHAIEPVAADFRKGHDGRRLALLKLVAGLTGVSLDSLVQRDAQARLRRVTAITVAALIAVVVMAGLLVVTLRARAEADRQRNEAEGLVEYMLTDLREKLKGVGRLDVMTAVNERAMAYYGDQQSMEGLRPESLNRRARIIEAMGADDEAYFRPKEARNKYLELRNITGKLLAENPDNPERIAGHANSENRLGLLTFTEKDYQAAVPHFLRADALLDKIKAIESARKEWVRLASLVQQNLCASLLRGQKKPIEALSHCQKALRGSDKRLKADPADTAALYDHVFNYAWLGEALAVNGDFSAALDAHARSLALIDDLVRRDPRNSLWLEQKAEIYLQICKIKERRVLPFDRSHLIHEAEKIARHLVSIDTTNQNWQRILQDVITLKLGEKSDVRL